MDNKKKDQSTEQRILVAAKKIFVQQGMAGARMQDIADEAGINKAMLHYYFRSKEKLFGVILKEATGLLIPRLSDVFNSDATLFAKIELFCEQYIGIVKENPYIPLFIISELNRQPIKFIENIWDRTHKSSLRMLSNQVNEEIEKGNIKAIQPFQLIINMLALCVFPFIGKPILQHVSGMSNEQYNQMLDERKKEVAGFIISAIKP